MLCPEHSRIWVKSPEHSTIVRALVLPFLGFLGLLVLSVFLCSFSACFPFRFPGFFIRFPLSSALSSLGFFASFAF